MILSCGKTINFLKRTGFSSPVINFAPAILDEDIQLIMTPEEVIEAVLDPLLLLAKDSQACIYKGAMKKGLTY